MLVAVILVSLAVFADAAPRSKSKGPQLVYDQKQKGDYNVQVHLKDFQIIALVGDDPLGDAGVSNTAGLNQTYVFSRVFY